MMFAGDTPAQIKANQEEFFNTLPKVTYANCSFNGSRSVRIAGNYFELNLNGYNYCKIEHTRNGSTYKFYGFIDLYRYVNDECCEIDITCDFIQTYLTEIQLAAPFIDQRNYSLNADLYKTPYHNFYPVSRVIENQKTIMQKSNALVFILSVSDEIANNFGIPQLCFPFDIGSQTATTTRNIYAVVYPLTNDCVPIQDITSNFDGNTYILEDVVIFLEKYSAYIIDVGICEYFNIIEDKNNTHYLNTDDGNAALVNIDKEREKYLILVGRTYTENLGYSKHFSIVNKDYYPALNISPYIEYRVGRLTSYFTINPFNKRYNDNQLQIDVKSNILGERENIVIFDNINSYDTISTFKNPCGYMFTTKDSWEMYRSTHSATVGDSLATKHKYDLEIAERNKQAGTNKTIASGIGGAIKTFIGYIEDAISSVTSLLSGNANIKIPITGIAKSATDIGVNTYKSVTDINTAYENAKTNIQKERDLLELEYNNIRNTPNEALNTDSNTYFMLYEEPTIKIAVAENIEQIKKYHKKFGFQTSLQSDNDMTLSQLHDKAARHFDYIVTKNASIISETIPKSAAANIEKIFDNGIYLWRDYNKLGEDYFSNYNGE